MLIFHVRIDHKNGGKIFASHYPVHRIWNRVLFWFATGIWFTTMSLARQCCLSSVVVFCILTDSANHNRQIIQELTCILFWIEILIDFRSQDVYERITDKYSGWPNFLLLKITTRLDLKSLCKNSKFTLEIYSVETIQAGLPNLSYPWSIRNYLLHTEIITIGIVTG